MTETIALAVIGGTGIYQMPGLTRIKEYDLDTPFGKPSVAVVVGTLEEKRIAFLARHGIGHHILPAEVNYRANIYALKMLGVERVVGINACGSLREDYAPGHIIIPDQIFDNTRKRTGTFFGQGFVAHIGVADPFCSNLSSLGESALQQAGAVVHRGGAFIIIEGPRFSTRAESQTFRAWGMSIIGMTAAPEAFLAREAEMCYTVFAHVTDFDVWHVNEKPVTVEMVLNVLHDNTHTAQEAIRHLVKALPVNRGCDCEQALATSIITDPKVISQGRRKELDLLIGKYIKKAKS